MNNSNEDNNVQQEPNNYGNMNQPQMQQPNNYGNMNQPQMQQMSNNYGNMNQPQMQQMPNNYGNMNQPQMQQMPNNYGNMNQPQMQQMSNNYGNMNQPQMQQMPNNYGNMNQPQMQQMSNNYGNMNQPQMQQMPNNHKKTNIFKNKIVIIIAVAAALLIIFLLLRGKNSNGYENRKNNYDRLIMLYMVGSNLESGDIGLGTLDLNGIEYSSLKNNNTKLIAIVGGAKKWHNSYIDINSTSIYELTENGYKIVKKQNVKNMGDPSVLSDFLNYGYDNYHAQKYDLIFWNHGLGAVGYGSDELSDDLLLLDEINNAFKNTKFEDDNKLELIAFRSCLNGTLEVADTLKKYSEYMVASQEITIGYSGNSLFKLLNNVKSSDNGQQFGIKFVDGYMDYVNQLNSAGSYTYNTYSVIDLSKIDNIETALSNFVNDINLSSNYYLIAKARSSTLQYAFNSEPSYDTIDLYTFINKISYLSQTKANQLLNYISDAIVYNKSTDSRSKGLSIYFPYNGETDFKKGMLKKLYNFANLKDYKNFIISFNNIQNSNTSPMNFSNSSIKLIYDSKNKSADFQFDLTDEQVKRFDKASFIIFEKEDDDYYFPVYNSKNIQIEDNILKGNIKDRQLKIVSKSKNAKTLLTYKFHEDDITKLDLDYKNEQQINLIEEEETNDYIMYYALVLLSNRGIQNTDENLNITNGKIYLKLEKSTGKVSIDKILIGKQEKNDNNDIPTTNYLVVANLEDYNYITFTFTPNKIPEKIEDLKLFDGPVSFIQVETNAFTFELENYNTKKEYYALFQIDDIYGNRTYSNLIKIK